MNKHKAKIRDRFRKFLYPLNLKGHFLDIGSGNEPYFYHDDMKKRGLKITGIDIAKLPTVDIVCDANNMPFKDETFDGAFCMSVLQYSGYEGVVKETARVIKKGGIALFEIPSAETAKVRSPLRTLIKKWMLRKKDTVEEWAGRKYTYEQISKFHKYDRKTFTLLCKKNNLQVFKIVNFERRFLPQHILVFAKKE